MSPALPPSNFVSFRRDDLSSIAALALWYFRLTFGSVCCSNGCTAFPPRLPFTDLVFVQRLWKCQQSMAILESPLYLLGPSFSVSGTVTLESHFRNFFFYTFTSRPDLCPR